MAMLSTTDLRWRLCFLHPHPIGSTILLPSKCAPAQSSQLVASRFCLTACASKPTPRASASDRLQHTLSRRSLLQTATSLALSSLLPSLPPRPASAGTGGAAAGGAASSDFIFDAHSGSYIPPSGLDRLLRRDAGALFDRCIVAGEVHDNRHTHTAQLAVIDTARRLPDGRLLVVGFEQFYRSHDALLDAYVQRRLSLAELLRRTKWDTTWGFDFALYAPIFQYCRQHAIPMRGLNLPNSITSTVAEVGVEGLPEPIRRLLPDGMDFGNKEHYDNFLQLILGSHHLHSGVEDGMLKRYYQVQVLWEEWMSQSVAISLRANPDARVVALMGTGHVTKRFGFPDRLQKRTNERPYTIVPIPVNWTESDGYSMPDIDKPAVGAADLLWYTRVA